MCAPPEGVSHHSICPLVRDRVKLTKQFPHSDALGVDDTEHGFEFLHLTSLIEQCQSVSQHLKNLGLCCKWSTNLVEEKIEEEEEVKLGKVAKERTKEKEEEEEEEEKEEEDGCPS